MSRGRPCPKHKLKQRANSEMTREEASGYVKELLDLIPLGTPEEILQGENFYAVLYREAPHLRKVFAGFEHFTPEEVGKSDHFKKAGVKFVVAFHLLMAVFDNEKLFRSKIHSLINSHDKFELDEKTWTEFPSLFWKFLTLRGATTPEQHRAFKIFSEVFSKECSDYLKELLSE